MQRLSLWVDCEAAEEFASQFVKEIPLRKKHSKLRNTRPAAELLEGRTLLSTTYSAAGDFSLTANPSGVWSYGERATETSSFSLYNYNGVSGLGDPIQGWSDGEGVLPLAVINTGSTTFNGSTYNIPPGVIEMHPGSDGTYSDVRFTAPASGPLSVNFNFIGIDVEGTTTDVHVLQNGTPIADGNINGYQDAFGKTVEVANVAAGDTFDFIVGFGSNDSYISDSTSLTATITPGNALALTPVTAFNSTASIQSNLIAQVPTGAFTTNNAFATPFDIPTGQNVGQTVTGTVTADVNLSGVTGVYTLMNAYAPQPGADIGTLTFNYADGTSVSDELISGLNIRDYYDGQYENTVTGSNVENAFTFNNVQGGAGTSDVATGNTGTYMVDEQYWGLSDTSTLVSVQITSPNGNNSAGGGSGSGTPALFGLTVAHFGGAGAAPVKSIGGLDPTFGTNGLASHDVGFTSTNGVATDGSQSVLIGPIGTSPNQSFGVTRYNGDGSLDTTFGSGGVTTTSFGSTDDVPAAVSVLSNGDILVAGTATTPGVGSEFAIAEYTSAGILDTSFGNGGQMLVSFSPTAGALTNDVLHAMTIAANGTIYLGGGSDAAGAGNTDFAVAALSAGGALVTGFGNGGVITTDIAAGDDVINSLAVQSNGDVVAAGAAIVNGVSEVALARFDTNGALDKKFGDKGIVTDAVGSVYDSASSVVIQPKGQIVIGGLTTTGSGSSLTTDFLLQRYMTAGKLDRSFGSGGTVDTSFDQPAAVTQVLLQSNGSIVASGKTSTVLGGTLDVATARYTTKGALDTSFAGTGKVIIDLGTGIVPQAASTLGAAFDAFTQSLQGVVAVTQGGEILDAGNSGVNTVEAELITAGVDLVAKLLSTLPSSILAGLKGSIKLSITESGTTAAAGAVTVEIQFATDAAGDNASTPVNTGLHVNLKQGATKPFAIKFTYPAGLAAGSYFLVATVVNGAGVPADLDTSNNAAASDAAVTIAPAFVTLNGANLSTTSIRAGKTATFTLTITNNGNVKAVGKSEVDFYVSTDTTVADGALLGVAPLPVSLAAGKSKVYRLKVAVPATAAAGTFNLLGVIDPNNSLPNGDASDTVVIDPVPVVVS